MFFLFIIGGAGEGGGGVSKIPPLQDERNVFLEPLSPGKFRENVQKEIRIS